jgi:hypothetical protein
MRIHVHNYMPVPMCMLAAPPPGGALCTPPLRAVNVHTSHGTWATSSRTHIKRAFEAHLYFIDARACRLVLKSSLWAHWL